MWSFSFILISVSLLLAACALFWGLHQRLTARRILKSLNEMLTAAIDGSFSETRFDETLLSAVESRLARYLSASAVSARNLTEEKDKIKSLIGDISHQTKTPIANILLYAQLLSEQELPEQSKPCVTALNAQAEKLRFLIDALVKTSRLETGVLAMRPRLVPVEPMLESALDQIRLKAAAKDVRLSIDPTDAYACLDPKWTAEALYNILDNAVKYTPGGGSVYIRTLSYDAFIRMDVTDTGIGIPEDEQAKVFQRFYRSPSAGDLEGVGVGLYLTRQIISAQGGYIKLCSLGQGSTFSVFLPREPGNLSKPSE